MYAYVEIVGFNNKEQFNKLETNGQNLSHLNNEYTDHVEHLIHDPRLDSNLRQWWLIHFKLTEPAKCMHA